MPGEPPVITAGDTLQFTHTDEEYTIEDWTLSYNLVATSNFYSFQASLGSGYAFSASIAAATTSSWAAGVYRWISFVSKGSGVTLERHQREQGTLEILPNWAAQTSGYDQRSHVKKTLDALEAMLLGKASRDQMSYSIGGRALSRMGPGEILSWRDRYRAEYEAELQAQNDDRPRPGRVLIKFTG